MKIDWNQKQWLYGSLVLLTLGGMTTGSCRKETPDTGAAQKTQAQRDHSNQSGAHDLPAASPIQLPGERSLLSSSAVCVAVTRAR